MHENDPVQGARGRACWWLIAGAMLLFTAATARADGQPAGGDPKARAQVHYEAGVCAYNIGEFESAIREWKEGYRILALPDFLFNIAQAYRGTRDHQNALFFYNAFLRERPDAPNVEEVTALRDEMQRILAEQRAAAPEGPGPKEAPVPARPAPEEPPPVAALTSAPVDPRSSGRSVRLTGAAVAGGGAALLATGVVFSLAASSAAADLEAAAAEGAPWSSALEDRERAGKRNETLGVVFLATGSAAVVAGAITYVLGRRSGRAAISVAVAPISGGGLIATVGF
jgi:tetratricopeptide (TPR) repeat protein